LASGATSPPRRVGISATGSRPEDRFTDHEAGHSRQTRPGSDSTDSHTRRPGRAIARRQTNHSVATRNRQ
jgi:hypothetical protein